MKINVGVFFGGVSCEHDISIITAILVMNNLDDSKYKIIPIYVTKEGKMRYVAWDYQNPDDFVDNVNFVNVSIIDGKVFKIGRHFIKKLFGLDVGILCFHGKNGEDGTFSAIMEINQIPYINSNISGSSIGLDKVLFKYFVNALNVPSVKSVDFSETDWFENKDYVLSKIDNVLNYPVILKPSRLGSSIGIEVCNNERELLQKIHKVFDFDSRILVEKYLKNCTEINVAVFKIENKLVISDLEKPIKNEEILSFTEKYIKDSNEKNDELITKEFPAKVSSFVKNKIIFIAKKIYTKLDLYGVVRFDFILDENGKVFINEVNTIPGSYAYYLYKNKDLNFTKILDLLIKDSLVEFSKNKTKIKYFNSSVLKSVNIIKK